MLTIRPSAAEWAREVVKSLNTFLERKPRGVNAVAPRREIAAALAFRITETALRGVTRFPGQLTQADVAGVMAHFPHHQPENRRNAKALLTVIIREEINSGRLIAAEIESRYSVVKHRVQEYAIMTVAQWEALQRDKRGLGTTKYTRALTSK